MQVAGFVSLVPDVVLKPCTKFHTGTKTYFRTDASSSVLRRIPIKIKSRRSSNIATPTASLGNIFHSHVCVWEFNRKGHCASLSVTWSNEGKY